MRNVVAIIHTYARDGELGSYMYELIQAFAQYPVRLHLIITNHLIPNLNSTHLHPSICEKKLVNFINDLNPDFVFTTNRGGITKMMMRELECPIITWMVDRIPFLHHGGDHSDLFCKKDYVITSSHKNVNRLETIYPVLKNRVFFLPFATNLHDFKTEIEKDINVSFIGTLFYCGRINELFNKYSHEPALIQSVIQLMQDIESNYDLDLSEKIEAYSLADFLKKENIDIYKFKGLLANTISSSTRFRLLDAIADLGLKLYGTSNWLNVGPYSNRLLHAFQFDTFIKTREQLATLYQRSRIAVNIPHIQAVDGLPYRVYDILASSALLISNYRENSDLFRLFGKDMPVPLYRNESDLRKKVSYFLKNEEERLAIVKQCNQLVCKNFSFNDRVKQFYEIIGKEINPGKGEIISVDVSIFQKLTSSIIYNPIQNRIIHLLLRSSYLKKMAKNFLPNKMIEFLKNVYLVNKKS